MSYIKQLTGICALILLLASCKSDPAKGFDDLDLMKHGLPIKIKAPADAVVEVSDLGWMKDVTVEKGDKFSLQITASNTTSLDKGKLIAEQKSTIEKGKYFSKIISEDEHGLYDSVTK